MALSGEVRRARKGEIWVLLRDNAASGSYFWDDKKRPGLDPYTANWQLDECFDSLEDAIAGAREWRKDNPTWPGLLSVAEALVKRLWAEEDQSDMSPLMGDCSSFEIMVKKMVAKEGSVTHYWCEDELMPAPAGEKESHVSDIKKPLHIPRKTLVARLEEVLGEKEQVRSDAEAEFSERRAKYTAAIKDFTDDELTNIIDSYVHMNIDELKKAKEDKRFVSVDSKPTPVEDQLAKQVRVLKMASDEDIEIAPSDNLYPLL